MDIKPIETRYKGYRFRSRLEARWAVFFDALGVKWEYEPEGYDLGEAGWYLPDFWLPDFDCWIEIKSDKNKATDAENKKCAHLAVMSGKFVYMFGQCAPVCFSNDYWRCQNDGRYFSPEGDRDGLILWGFCDMIQKVTLGWWGMLDMSYYGIRYGKFPAGSEGCIEDLNYEECCYGEMPSEYHHDHARIIAAFNAARSARFEHGESGAK
jgi:hypothetical protein